MDARCEGSWKGVAENGSLRPVTRPHCDLVSVAVAFCYCSLLSCIYYVDASRLAQGRPLVVDVVRLGGYFGLLGGAADGLGFGVDLVR